MWEAELGSSVLASSFGQLLPCKPQEGLSPFCSGQGKHGAWDAAY